MKTEMLMPQMGESIAEATVLKWYKGVGDKVSKDEIILEISTDKVDSEIPSPIAGIVSEIRVPTGQTVPVKSVIAVIETTSTSELSNRSPNLKPTLTGEKVEETTESAQHIENNNDDNKKSFYSPLVRNIAKQNNISTKELEEIQGSGNQGRITKTDIIEYIETKKNKADESEILSSSPSNLTTKGEASHQTNQQGTVSEPGTSSPNYNERGICVEPMDNMRKRIAEHMVRSKATSPHVYSVAEIDLTNIVKAKENHSNSFFLQEGFKLTYTPFFIEAVVHAIRQYPRINASMDGENIILKKFINIGCAVALGNSGLVVPVIKNTEQLNFVGIARALNDLASRVRSRKLLPEETRDGTFTITNPGIFGNIMGFPIINQPQAAILAIGAIKKQVAVVNNMIAIRDIAYFTLSYDHRLLDGSMSGQFLQCLTKYLENWDATKELL